MNLKRNKSYAFLNTLGLAVGIAACLLLFLVIQYETSFDNFHPKKASIYRIGTEFISPLFATLIGRFNTNKSL